MPTLYSYYRSSCSYRVRIALNLKGIPYDYIPVHLVKEGGEQYQENYKQMNPQSQVPFFVDGDFKTSQSLAIIDYIDNKWTQSPRLLSIKVEERARQIEMIEIINSGIQPLQNLGVLHQLTERFDADSEVKAKWCRHWIEKGFHALEIILKNTSGIYSTGESVSAVDCFLVPQVYNANRFNIEMTKFPIINKINKNALALEPIQKASPSCQPDTPTGES